MNRTKLKNFISLFLAALIILALCACGEAPASPEPAPAAPAELTQGSAALEPAAAETVETAEPVQTAEQKLPAEEPLPTPQPTPEPEREYTGPDLTAAEPVDDAFFADAAFFGNSLVRGLEMFGGLEQGEFFAVTSASVVNVGVTKNTRLSDGTESTMLQALCEKSHGKIYILLGINEIGFETPYFIELFSAMLDEIKENEPDADIYIMSLTPVTEKKSAEGALFSEAHVLEYNEALRALAEERRCWYVDLVDALQGEDGYLPAEQSTDGIHLTADKYPEWADYLRTHYAAE